MKIIFYANTYLVLFGEKESASLIVTGPSQPCLISQINRHPHYCVCPKATFQFQLTGEKLTRLSPCQAQQIGIVHQDRTRKPQQMEFNPPPE